MTLFLSRCRQPYLLFTRATVDWFIISSVPGHLGPKLLGKVISTWTTFLTDMSMCVCVCVCVCVWKIQNNLTLWGGWGNGFERENNCRYFCKVLNILIVSNTLQYLILLEPSVLKLLKLQGLPDITPNCVTLALLGILPTESVIHKNSAPENFYLNQYGTGRNLSQSVSRFWLQYLLQD